MSSAVHTVLAVDDEVEVIESLRRTLRREPYRFIGTTSPHHALQLLGDGDIDLLVADIDMPEMSGLELIEHVQVHYPQVVRILLTGDASLESAMTAINEGEVHRFLTKPWEKDHLRQTIRGALDRLEELRSTAQASQRVRARDRLLDELEREHPGIGDVPPSDDTYFIDEARVLAVVPSTPTALRALLEPDEDPPAEARSLTRRIR